MRVKFQKMTLSFYKFHCFIESRVVLVDRICYASTLHCFVIINDCRLDAIHLGCILVLTTKLDIHLVVMYHSFSSILLFSCPLDHV
ncbi:hypothetical protein HanRHA438_Chr09g0420291 [Helianthus annuus]|nr:hypothetical protein HanRHA438_Chr09g0420291 [Helianthus annuus]